MLQYIESRITGDTHTHTYTHTHIQTDPYIALRVAPKPPLVRCARVQLIQVPPPAPKSQKKPEPDLHREESISVVVPELRAPSSVFTDEMVLEVRSALCVLRSTVRCSVLVLLLLFCVQVHI